MNMLEIFFNRKIFKILDVCAFRLFTKVYGGRNKSFTFNYNLRNHNDSKFYLELSQQLVGA
jgi:hypothetical protein